MSVRNNVVLAGSVGADQRYDLTLVQIEADIDKDLAIAVADDELLDAEQAHAAFPVRALANLVPRYASTTAGSLTTS